MQNTNACLELIAALMSEHRLVLVLNKTEASIMKGRRTRDRVFFTLMGIDIKPPKVIAYLI